MSCHRTDQNLDYMFIQVKFEQKRHKIKKVFILSECQFLLFEWRQTVPLKIKKKKVSNKKGILGNDSNSPMKLLTFL